MDPGISLDWITPDRTISAFIGALAAAVALMVDQRRRHDESKNRFSEEKLRAYERMVSRFEVMGEFRLLFGEFAALFRKLDRGEDLDAEEARAKELLNERLDSIVQKYDKYAEEEPSFQLSLLCSDGLTRAAYRLVKVIDKMQAHVDARDYEKVGRLALRYEMASAGLLLAARSDLGIRN